MVNLKIIIRVVAILAALIGLIWIGQGTGYFPYPASSFMIAHIEWAYYGAGVMVAAGLVLWRVGR